MNAVDLLKTDHLRVRNLFRQFEKSESFSEKKEILGFIKEELELHIQAEEAVFYPHFQVRDEYKDIIEESYEEHERIKGLLSEISTEEEVDDEDAIENTFRELLECVEHHLEEEEEELFTKVEENCSDEELNLLGERLDETKRSVLESEAA